MNLHRFKPAAAAMAAMLLFSSAWAEGPAGDKVDLEVLAKIKQEAYQNTQVMDHLYYLSEVYGPRVNNSRNYRAAAEWAMQQMRSWGMKNVHLESFPFGYGWQIKKYYGALESPAYASIPGFPLAWTPGTDGPVTADAVFAPIHSPEDFAKYKGKLKGKIVLIFDPAVLPLHTTPEAAKSPTDEEVLARASAPRGPGGPGGPNSGPADRDPSGRGRHGEGTWKYTPTSQALSGNHDLRNELNAFLKEEAPAVVLTPGYNGDGGTIFGSYGGSQNPSDPVPPPMLAIGAEQYNRIIRLLQHGTTPKLTFDVQVEYQKKDPNSVNIIGEIPGATKPEEVVMLGGHFDSWQGGTGATDNGTGSSVALEAMRILTTLKKPMDRTVRVALWGGEEEGLFGSIAYVQQHFAPRDTMKKTSEYDKFDIYFNDDGGSGRFRGVSSLGNPELAAIFQSWIDPIRDQHIVAVSGGMPFRPSASPGGTDSTSFTWIGLNGVSFMQDTLEYGTRTHHSNADLYDRAQKDDLMQGSLIEAWFAYNAATRPEMLPRLPTPEPLKK